tara:strand:+ start:393 stop:575 length:183 start_codon:yes stop_codon:yes gene_type:complete
MQLKLQRQKSLGQSLISKVLKSLIVLGIVFLGFFLIEKVKFPSPKENFKIDITNEVNKLK